MLSTLIEKLFGGANFNKLMFVLAIEGGIYFFTQEWIVWTLLNSIIFGIIGYCLLTSCIWLYNKLKPSEFKSFEKESKKEWDRNVKSFFYRLPEDIKLKLLSAYTMMEKDVSYFYQRNSKELNNIILCRNLSRIDWHVLKKGYYGDRFENCISISEQNGVISIIFDPVICKELDKMKKQKNTKL